MKSQLHLFLSSSAVIAAFACASTTKTHGTVESDGGSSGESGQPTSSAGQKASGVAGKIGGGPVSASGSIGIAGAHIDSAGHAAVGGNETRSGGGRSAVAGGGSNDGSIDATAGRHTAGAPIVGGSGGTGWGGSSNGGAAGTKTTANDKGGVAGRSGGSNAGAGGNGAVGGSSGGVGSSGAAGGGASGGVAGAGASSCPDDGDSASDEFIHKVYGCGHRFGGSSSPDYWVVFDSGLNYDKRTGYGWLQLPSFRSQSQGIADCAASTVGGITSWQLPTVTQVRTLAGGCAPTEPGGTCRIGDSCLALACGTDSQCKSCLGSGGPHPSLAYERANVRVSTYTHTTSKCSDCPSTSTKTEWIYHATNGLFAVFDPSYLISVACVTTAVPNF